VTTEDVAAFERAIAADGVGLFPADTVYGLAADPESPDAVERLYAIKGRPPDRPAAVMFFALDRALAALPRLGPRTRSALERLLPGAVTLVLPNPERHYPLACGPEPDRIGVRVPNLLGELAPLRAVSRPVLQSSANPSGGGDARRLADVHPELRAAVDVVLDAGELPGTPSTVIDLTGYEDGGSWELLREGAVARAELDALL
jgi:L-threonylcarbamoyladenylate synthase